jgi:hypothetical protein
VEEVARDLDGDAKCSTIDEEVGTDMLKEAESVAENNRG